MYRTRSGAHVGTDTSMTENVPPGRRTVAMRSASTDHWASLIVLTPNSETTASADPGSNVASRTSAATTAMSSEP